MSFPSLKDQQPPLMYVYIYVCVYICVCIWMFIWIRTSPSAPPFHSM